MAGLRSRIGCIAVFAVACCVALLLGLEAFSAYAQPSQAAANATGNASSITVFRYGWSNDKYHAKRTARTAKYDVTGDGIADTIAMRAAPLGEAGRGLIAKITVELNGSEIYQMKSSKRGFDQVQISIVTLQNNKPFVFVDANDANGTALQELLAWKNGAFKAVASNALMNCQGVSNARISQVLPSGNRVILQFDFVSCVTGVSRTSFAYEYRSGTLALTDRSTRALRYATTAQGAFTREPRVAARSFDVYSDKTLSTRSFVAKAGAQVRVLALRVQGGLLLHKLKVGSKRGWIACPAADDQNVGGLLKGVYGKVAQVNSAPAYSSTKSLSVTRLQKYSNHALFLARNELYARHGFKFTNEELAAHFSKKSWYKPRANAQVKLNTIESQNVALILKVERNRRSPYVTQ